MIQIPDNLTLKKKYWCQSIENIEIFLERRNYTFQHQLNDDIFLFQHNETGNPIFIILVYQEKMGIEHLKSYIQHCENTIIKDIIIIYQNNITTNCSKVIEHLFQYNIELFSLNEFQYDIKKLYYYVPHTKINDKELLKTIKDKYKNKLPILLRSDPISRYFGFKRNDIIQIDRNENEICFRQIR